MSFKESIQTAQRHMKRFSVSLVIMEMSIRTTRTPFHTHYNGYSQMTDENKYHKGEIETLIDCQQEYGNGASYFVKTCLAAPQNIKVNTLRNLSWLSIYTREIIDNHTKVHSSIVHDKGPRCRNNPNAHQLRRQINKMWYIHIMKYHWHKQNK